MGKSDGPCNHKHHAPDDGKVAAHPTQQQRARRRRAVRNHQQPRTRGSSSIKARLIAYITSLFKSNPSIYLLNIIFAAH